MIKRYNKVVMRSDNDEKATLGGGCFWCTEALFRRLKGVRNVIAGYAGGTNLNPTYQQVCSGTTGHAEVAQITFNPKIISYEQLLDVFWQVHDPTSLNRQGNDVGTQYRSVIFYHNQQQKKIAEQSKVKLAQSGPYQSAIVTEIAPLTNFCPAEDYHQQYYEKNSYAPYCRFIIAPKIRKMQEVHPLPPASTTAI